MQSETHVCNMNRKLFRTDIKEYDHMLFYGNHTMFVLHDHASPLQDNYAVKNSNDLS